MDDPYLKWQLIELSFFEQILRAEHNCLLLSAVRGIKSYFILQIFQTEYLFLSNRPQFYSSFQIKIGLLNTNYYLYLGLYLSYFQTFSWQLRGFQKWLFSTFPILSFVADRWYRSWYSEHSCTFTFVTSNHWLSGTTLCTIMQQYSYKWLMSRNCINKLLPFGSIKPKPFRECQIYISLDHAS